MIFSHKRIQMLFQMKTSRPCGRFRFVRNSNKILTKICVLRYNCF